MSYGINRWIYYALTSGPPNTNYRQLQNENNFPQYFHMRSMFSNVESRAAGGSRPVKRALSCYRRVFESMTSSAG